MLKFYGYKKCSTCRAAEKALARKGIAYAFIDITEHPPSAAELKALAESGGMDPRKHLNTSGEAYRALGLKDKVKAMSDAELMELMAANGRLIKRPFVTDGRAMIPATEWKA